MIPLPYPTAKDGLKTESETKGEPQAVGDAMGRDEITLAFFFLLTTALIMAFVVVVVISRMLVAGILSRVFLCAEAAWLFLAAIVLTTAARMTIVMAIVVRRSLLLFLFQQRLAELDPGDGECRMRVASAFEVLESTPVVCI
jgi:hypothetical protein